MIVEDSVIIFVSSVFGFFKNKQDSDLFREVVHWVCYLILVIGFLFLLSRQSQAGIVSSWISGNQPKIENPCKNSRFQKKYGKYCSGFLNKEIRCLSDGKNVGVCDGASVCGEKNQGTKFLCEKYCLNASSQNLGNQYIQVQCRPRPEVVQPEPRQENSPKKQIQIQRIGTPKNLPVPVESLEQEDYADITDANSTPPASSIPLKASSARKKPLLHPKQDPQQKEYGNAYFDAITQDYRHYFWGMAD